MVSSLNCLYVRYAVFSFASRSRSFDSIKIEGAAALTALTTSWIRGPETQCVCERCLYLINWGQKYIYSTLLARRVMDPAAPSNKKALGLFRATTFPNHISRTRHTNRHHELAPDCTAVWFWQDCYCCQCLAGKGR